jgi:hypothetical protein
MAEGTVLQIRVYSEIRRGVWWEKADEAVRPKFHSPMLWLLPVLCQAEHTFKTCFDTKCGLSGYLQPENTGGKGPAHQFSSNCHPQCSSRVWQSVLLCCLIVDHDGVLIASCCIGGLQVIKRERPEGSQPLVYAGPFVLYHDKTDLNVRVGTYVLAPIYMSLGFYPRHWVRIK